MIRTLIIEDEKPAALRLQKLLKAIEPEIAVIDVLDTIDSAVTWLNNNQSPDLIMLDIQLGDGLSFDIFTKVSVESYIIFTTAYDEYAVRAFELNSIDYLLKPVSEEKLGRSLVKYKNFRGQGRNINLEKLLDSLEKRESKFKKRFVITVAGKIKVIESDSIAFFSSKEKNTFLTSSENRTFPVDFSLDQIEAMMNPETFFRVNRQYIIQYRHIERIDLLSKSRIRITTVPPSGEEILVSTSRTSDFRQWLER